MSEEPQLPPGLQWLFEGDLNEASLRTRLSTFGKSQLINIIVLMWVLIASMKGLQTHLQAALNLDSHNSSKPPSSDGYDKPAPKSQRTRSGRKSGGQPGHKGSTLRKVDNPDHTVPVPTVRRCPCGKCLTEANVIKTESRQVFDVPEPQPLEVTEYVGDVMQCDDCGMIHRPQFPGDVSQPVQYGPVVQALVAYLNRRQTEPYGRTQETMRDIFRVELSQGTIKNILARGHEVLCEDFTPHAKGALIASPVVGFDETGMRYMKESHWLHVASTETITIFHFDKNRGNEAMERMGILPHFKGTAVHDGLPAYHTYEQCAHALCNSHHLRELIFAKEEYEQAWAHKMITFLCKVNAAVNEAKVQGKNSLPPETLQSFSKQYSRILSAGAKELPRLPAPPPGKRGRPKRHKIENLYNRFVAHKDAVLAFMFNFAVPFTNNMREQDIRGAKIKQKVSGCFRSFLGGEMFASFGGYLSTARKQGHRAFRALTALYTRDWDFIRGLTKPGS
jgi:transposase